MKILLDYSKQYSANLIHFIVPIVLLYFFCFDEIYAVMQYDIALKQKNENLAILSLT